MRRLMHSKTASGGYKVTIIQRIVEVGIGMPGVGGGEGLVWVGRHPLGYDTTGITRTGLTIMDYRLSIISVMVRTCPEYNTRLQWLGRVCSNYSLSHICSGWHWDVPYDTSGSN